MKEIIGIWEKITNFKDAYHAKEVKITLPCDYMIRITHWRFKKTSFTGINGFTIVTYSPMMILDLIDKGLIYKYVKLDQKQVNKTR